MVPSPKLVTNANLPLPVITAQHTSVRVPPTVPVTSLSWPSPAIW